MQVIYEQYAADMKRVLTTSWKHDQGIDWWCHFRLVAYMLCSSGDKIVTTSVMWPHC